MKIDWFQTSSALQTAPSVLPVALSPWLPLSTCHLVNFATLFKYFPAAEMHLRSTQHLRLIHHFFFFGSDHVASLSHMTGHIVKTFKDKTDTT